MGKQLRGFHPPDRVVWLSRCSVDLRSLWQFQLIFSPNKLAPVEVPIFAIYHAYLWDYIQYMSIRLSVYSRPTATINNRNGKLPYFRFFTLTWPNAELSGWLKFVFAFIISKSKSTKARRASYQRERGSDEQQFPSNG
jgi:hypothetical protein